MKYLLSWVCQHLEIENWQTLGTIEEIVKKISLHTAEISSYKSISYDETEIGIAKIINVTDSLCIAQYNDQEKIINLPVGIPVQEGFSYLVILTKQKRYRFATMRDFHSELKNHMLSPIYGETKDNILFLERLKKDQDYILTIDSVSIGHRPDLFSHRGLARELAILFNQKLKQEKEIFYDIPLFNKHKESFKQKSKLLIKNKAKNIESFAALEIKLNETPSILEHIVNLSCLDITSHSFLVDTSNYVMFDIGQPLHVFDREQIKSLTFRDDVEGEFLALDNTKIIIKQGNIVLEDENKNITSLVGIMGGKQSEVSLKTKEVLIESVCLKKETIKKTIKLYGKKTESAIRMEKGTSLKAPQFALRAFLQTVKKHQQIGHFEPQLEYTTEIFEPEPIVLPKEYINKIIGISITEKFTLDILEKIGCMVENNQENFIIKTPWWRQDLHDTDNIIEEIARFFGYDNIPLIAPAVKTNITKKDSFIENLKKQTVSLGKAQEIFSYGIASQEVKKAWKIENTQEVTLKNPYNDRLSTLTTNYLGNLLEIANKELKLGITESRFFEINPIWQYQSEKITEELMYTFLGCSEEKEKDFYFYKDIIKNIYQTFGYDLFFQKQSLETHQYYSKIKSDIYLGSRHVGTCGFLDPLLTYKNTKSAVLFFGCEINLSFLREQEKKNKGCQENFLSFDISCLILKTEKIGNLEELLKIAFGYIAFVKIIDWFESPEWQDMRSVTFRIYVFTQEINNVYKEVKEYLKERVCKIR